MRPESRCHNWEADISTGTTEASLVSGTYGGAGKEQPNLFFWLRRVQLTLFVMWRLRSICARVLKWECTVARLCKRLARLGSHHEHLSSFACK